MLCQSPGFGGLRFNAIYATGESNGHHSKQNYGGNGTYLNGNFGATLAVQRLAAISSRLVEAAIYGGRS